ncbi:hypothetical protein BDA96_08G084400 [Sorghum bicolor]|uniref:Uncharacterized protein n=2 Tax=Sorghum bicolor TaxID=4558 RepID=A0A921U7L0_SORBI|nr:hypothetical protein BDA96_08G084400 [Sorghum bicolor]OQU78962.1 hypothetical protein SORBI_3008G078966 [Sorghum bicolor]
MPRLASYACRHNSMISALSTTSSLRDSAPTPSRSAAHSSRPVRHAQLQVRRAQLHGRRPLPQIYLLPVLSPKPAVGPLGVDLAHAQPTTSIPYPAALVSLPSVACPCMTPSSPHQSSPPVSSVKVCFPQDLATGVVSFKSE